MTRTMSGARVRELVGLKQHILEKVLAGIFRHSARCRQRLRSCRSKRASSGRQSPRQWLFTSHRTELARLWRNAGWIHMASDPYFQLVAKGVIILLAVLIDGRVRQHLAGATQRSALLLASRIAALTWFKRHGSVCFLIAFAMSGSSKMQTVRLNSCNWLQSGASGDVSRKLMNLFSLNNCGHIASKSRVSILVLWGKRRSIGSKNVQGEPYHKLPIPR
jgi:hypothetical protein